MLAAFGLMVCLGFWRHLKTLAETQGAVQRTGDLSLRSCCGLLAAESRDLAPLPSAEALQLSGGLWERAGPAPRARREGRGCAKSLGWTTRFPLGPR